MLVLSRFTNQGVTIFTPAGEVTVKVVRQEGEKVKLGIEAPLGFLILREELVANHNQSRVDTSPPACCVIDANTARLAAIVANVDAPQDARVRALQQLAGSLLSPGPAVAGA